jgi:hypothetical protein
VQDALYEALFFTRADGSCEGREFFKSVHARFGRAMLDQRETRRAIKDRQAERRTRAALVAEEAITLGQAQRPAAAAAATAASSSSVPSWSGGVTSAQQQQQRSAEERAAAKVARIAAARAEHAEDAQSVHSEHRSIRIDLMMAFMQLCCEGHCASMQLAMHSQTAQGNQVSRSIVEAVAALFVEIGRKEKRVAAMSAREYQYLAGAIDFMVECVQGPCFQNQEVLASPELVDACRKVLTR